MEAVFSHLKGVTSVVSGFEGGRAADADYETVSTGTTGHAESIRVTYDPARIRYDQLLQVFFGVASDPTQLNRQEPDEGPHIATRWCRSAPSRPAWPAPIWRSSRRSSCGNGRS
jgi:methionine-S-sulfoxide reductase